MKVAIMQPYLFPYVGYFQLLNEVDIFVVFDDVNYIKKGWINKNQLLINNAPWKFTFPVNSASQNKLINEHFYKDLDLHKRKFLTSLESSYKATPYFEDLYKLVRLCFKQENNNVSEFNTSCLQDICNFLGIETKIILSSDLGVKKVSTAQQRLIDITKAVSGNTYLNLPGGRDLYSKSDFEMQGLNLEFTPPTTLEYSQSGEQFYPNLSILDLIANTEQQELVNLL